MGLSRPPKFSKRQRYYRTPRWLLAGVCDHALGARVELSRSAESADLLSDAGGHCDYAGEIVRPTGGRYRGGTVRRPVTEYQKSLH
jgi:hypothetical protein